MNDSIIFHEKGNELSPFSGFSPSCDHQQWVTVYSTAALSSDISGDPDEESGQELTRFLLFNDSKG